MSELKTTVEWVKLGEAGRIVIPARLRAAIGAKPGDRLGLMIDECGELHVFTQRQGIEHARKAFAPYVTDGYSIVDEFIAERRAEASRE